MKKSRFSALIIVAAMALALLAGCAGGGAPASTTGSESTTATSASTSASVSETTATEAKTDLGGYEFTLANPSSDEWSDAPANSKQEAVMAIYAEVEALLNCTISSVTIDVTTALSTTAMSNDKAADFIRCRQQDWASPAIKGYLRPVDTDEVKAAGLDVTDAGQVDVPYVGMSLLNGHLWTVAFSGQYFVSTFGHGVAFNKIVCGNAGYSADTIYKSVYDFTWDYDYIREICRAVSTDLDGDNVNEFEGIVTHDDTDLASNGANIVYQDENGKWKSGAGDPRFVTALANMMADESDPDVFMADREGMGWGDRKIFFYEGKAAFCSLWGDNFGVDADDCNVLMADDFGFIPVPHGPDATEYACLIPDYNSYVIQITDSDWDKACTIMGALGDRFTDVDQAKALYRDYFRDDESVAILYDVIFPIEGFMANRFSSEMRDSLDIIWDSLDAGDSAAVACEKAGLALQNAINDLFGY